MSVSNGGSSLLTHFVHLVIGALLLGWGTQLHIAHGNNAKAQFAVLMLALFGIALCWIWSNTLRGLRAAADVPFSAADPRTPWVVAVFYAVIAILAVGRIL